MTPLVADAIDAIFAWCTGPVGRESSLKIAESKIAQEIEHREVLAAAYRVLGSVGPQEALEGVPPTSGPTDPVGSARAWLDSVGRQDVRVERLPRGAPRGLHVTDTDFGDPRVDPLIALLKERSSTAWAPKEIRVHDGGVVMFVSDGEVTPRRATSCSRSGWIPSRCSAVETGFSRSRT